METTDEPERTDLFPTPIVVAFSKNAGDFFDFATKEKEDEKQRVRFGTLHLPKNPASIQIIDGQHRLFGYTRVKVHDPERHFMQVIAYKEPLPAGRDPAEMFVEINSEQKSVPSALLWELYPDIYGPEDENYHKAIISEVATDLVTRGLAKGLVSHISSGQKGAITFATLCNELNKSGLISKKGGLVASLASADDERKKAFLHNWLSIFFETLVESGKSHPTVNSNFIYSNVGFVPLFRTYSRILHKLSISRGSLEKKEEIRDVLVKNFAPLYTAYGRRTPGDLSNLKTQRVGESGFAETEDEMASIIQFESDPEYQGRGTITPVMRLAHDMAYSIHQLNRKGLSSGKTKEFVFPTFDYLAFKRRFQKVRFDQDSFAAILNLLYQEIVEGSGGKRAEDGSRLAKLMTLDSVVENPHIRLLDNLRNYWDHNLRVLRPEKRQDAISALKSLTGRSELTNVDELTSADFECATRKIMSDLADPFLKAAHTKLGA